MKIENNNLISESETRKRISYRGYIIRPCKSDDGELYWDIIKPKWSTTEPIWDWCDSVEEAKHWIDSDKDEPFEDSLIESANDGGHLTINFGYWINSKSFQNKQSLLKFLRSHIISSSSVITLAKNVTDDYENSIWYDTAENVQKFNLTDEQRHEIFEKGYTLINNDINEQMNRNPEDDGWPGIVKDITAQFFDRAAAIKYEIDNCVRGSFTVRGRGTVEDLITDLKELSIDLDYAIKDLTRDKANINEALDWQKYKITYSYENQPDKEYTDIFTTHQNDVEYAWRMSNQNVPHTKISKIERINEAKSNKAPKYWNSIFTTKVIDAYKSGKLNYDNIEDWETEYNDGVKPSLSLGTKAILDYYIKTGKDPRNVNESMNLNESTASDLVSKIKSKFKDAKVKSYVQRHSSVHKSNPNSAMGKTKYVTIEITPGSDNKNSIFQYCTHELKKLIDADPRADYLGETPVRVPRHSDKVIISYHDYSDLSDEEVDRFLNESMSFLDEINMFKRDLELANSVDDIKDLITNLSDAELKDVLKSEFDTAVTNINSLQKLKDHLSDISDIYVKELDDTLDEGIVHNADYIAMSISDILKKNGIDYMTIYNHKDYFDIEFYSSKAANDASRINWESEGFGDFKVNGSNAILNATKSINDSINESIKTTSVEPVFKLDRPTKSTLTKNKKYDITFDKNGNFIASTRHGKKFYVYGNIKDANDSVQNDEDMIAAAVREQISIQFNESSTLSKLVKSGYSRKEIQKFFKDETGLDMTPENSEEFKRWSAKFLNSIEESTDRTKSVYCCSECGFEGELFDDECEDLCCPNCHDHHGGFGKCEESICSKYAIYMNDKFQEYVTGTEEDAKERIKDYQREDETDRTMFMLNGIDMPTYTYKLVESDEAEDNIKMFNVDENFRIRESNNIVG